MENPTPPEKWVKYLAKYHYRIEIDHRDERAQSAKMATKESPASDSEWQLTDNELTVFDSIWQVVLLVMFIDCVPDFLKTLRLDAAFNYWTKS